MHNASPVAAAVRDASAVAATTRRTEKDLQHSDNPDAVRGALEIFGEGLLYSWWRDEKHKPRLLGETYRLQFYSRGSFEQHRVKGERPMN
jgi:hypothetical protein